LEGLCDNIGIMHKGKMYVEADIDALRTTVNKVQFVGDGDLTDLGLPIISDERRGSVHQMVIKGTYDEIHASLNRYNPSILDIMPLSLEEVFLYVLEGKELQDILSENGQTAG